MIARSVRLLPHPDSPTMARASPPREREGDAVHGAERPAVEPHLDDEPLDLQDRSHSGRKMSASPSPSSDRPMPVRTTVNPGMAAIH